MASGTQEHHHQQQQQQQQQDQLIQQQHQNNQMQFASNQATGSTTNFGSQQQIHQLGAMSPISAPMSVDNTQGHIISMNPHQHQQTHMMDTVMSSAMMGQDSCNQTTSHIQHQLTSQQQKSQLLPLLLSPRPPSLKSGSAETTEQPESDHDQIIEQVISLENEYSESSGTMANVDSNLDMMMGNQQQQQHGDINLTGVSCASDSNQLSSSSEDLLNLLLEFDGEPSNLIGLDGCQQLDPDEKAGIENIRKQLMSCEVQSDQAHNQNTNSTSPIINQMTCQSNQSAQVSQTSHNIHQQQQMLTQTGSVISHHQQQPHHLSSPLPQPAQQQILMHNSYSNVPVSTVPISSSGQSYAPSQQHQNVARISHSNPMSIVNNSPSPSWQQPQLSPYSPQNPLSNTRTTPSQRQNQHPTMPQHQNTTSPQMQQLHHPIQRASPSQSVSPPATTEPSPVVKKNPLLNAQLVNSRPPSITPTRFMNNQTNVLNQNPILNAKLSQSPFVNSSGGTVGSSLNQSLNTQPRFIQQPQQASNFTYDLNQQQHQQNAQQHTPPQQTVHPSLYRPCNDQQSQQQSNQIFKCTTASTSGISTGCGSPMAMGSTSPSGGLSQQVKQEIRRKVQQPKQQQHQTTSLLKQLLSDDNK